MRLGKGKLIMATFNKDKIETLKDYIYCLCYYRGVTIKQMCSDLDISYNTFKSHITKSIGKERLLKIIKYLDGNVQLALDLPLTVDNTDSTKTNSTKTNSNSLKVSANTGVSSLSFESFKDMVFDSYEDYLQQFEKLAKYYDEQNDIRSKVKVPGKASGLLTTLNNIVVEPMDIDDKTDFHYRFYVRRWDKPVYEVLTRDYVQDYLYLIIRFLGLESEKLSSWPKPRIVIEDLECSAYFKQLPLYNPAPAYYVLTLNGIFNRKTKKFYPENSVEYNKLTREYHFINNASFNYVTESKNPRIVDLYKYFINHISDCDEDLKNEIEQQLCSVLNGYSYNGLIFVKSTSTVNIDLLSELLEQLAGNYRYALMNVRNIRGNRSLNSLPYNLKLIYGSFDEGKVKLSDNVIDNCKRVFGNKYFGRQAFLTGKNNGYNNYFKLRAPWFQFVYNENDLKSLEQDTRNVMTKTIRISNKSINKQFVDKFFDTIDDKTIHNCNEGITIFSDEIASYLLNNVDYPAD